MPLDGKPAAIDGGELFAARMIRMMNYAATSGAEGIIGTGDFLVSAQSTPNGTVAIAAGGYVALNRFTGAKNESYIGRGTATPSLAIPANSSGGTKYHYLFIRIQGDEEFADQEFPTDRANGPYEEFYLLTDQANGLTRRSDFTLPYPAILLCRIAIPASTATILNTMITDLRTVANPRRDRQLRASALEGSDVDICDNSATDGETFPNPYFTVDVPAWATFARVIGMWNGVQVPTSSTTTGQLWVRLVAGTDVVDTQVTNFAAAGTGYSRQAYVASDDIAIPAVLRDRTCNLQLRGKETGGTGPLQMDNVGSFSIDIEFYERAADND